MFGEFSKPNSVRRTIARRFIIRLCEIQITNIDKRRWSPAGHSLALIWRILKDRNLQVTSCELGEFNSQLCLSVELSWELSTSTLSLSHRISNGSWSLSPGCFLENLVTDQENFWKEKILRHLEESLAGEPIAEHDRWFVLVKVFSKKKQLFTKLFWNLQSASSSPRVIHILRSLLVISKDA